MVRDFYEVIFIFLERGGKIVEGVPEPEALPVPLQGGDAGQAQGGPHPHTTLPLLSNTSFRSVATFNFVFWLKFSILLSSISQY